MADRKTTGVPKAHQGLHHNRCKCEHNEAELIVARAWHRQQKECETLSALMNPDGVGPVLGNIDRRDKLVAATVIQWLGSPVGHSWVSDVLRRIEAAERRLRAPGEALR